MNLNPKDYVLTEDDYFMEKTTMLTNEKAALKKCRELYFDLKHKNIKKFVDPDFGSKNDNDDS